MQYRVDINKTGEYKVVSAADAGVPNVAKAAYIVTNHMSMGTPVKYPADPSYEPAYEAASVQLALWHLTDGLELSAAKSPTVVARATELVGLAKDLDVAAPSMKVDSVPAGDQAKVSAVVSGSSGPASGVQVRFTIQDKDLVDDTDASGTAEVSTSDVGVPGSASAMVSAAAGTLVAPETGQILILADQVDVPVAGSFTTAVPEVAPSPGASKAASPPKKTKKVPADSSSTSTKKTSDPAPEELPHTGDDSALMLAGALAAVVAAGVTGAFWMRRRRS